MGRDMRVLMDWRFSVVPRMYIPLWSWVLGRCPNSAQSSGVSSFATWLGDFSPSHP